MPTNYLECLEKLVSDIKYGKYEIENIEISREIISVPSFDEWETYAPGDIIDWHIKLKVEV